MNTQAINIEPYLTREVWMDSEVSEVLIGGAAHGIMPQGEEAEFPYAVWAVQETKPQRTKDGMLCLSHVVGIEVVGRDYDTIADVIGYICAALEGAEASWESYDEKPFMVCSQDWEIGPEQFDLDHDGPYRRIELTLETL